MANFLNHTFSTRASYEIFSYSDGFGLLFAGLSGCAYYNFIMEYHCNYGNNAITQIPGSCLLLLALYGQARNATRWMTATQMLDARCKCTFLITHNELDLMTWASFEYWISHNRLQCPLMPKSLAHTVGDGAHVDLNNRWSKWGTDDALSLCRVLRSFLAVWERRVWMWKQVAQTSGGVNHMFD